MACSTKEPPPCNTSVPKQQHQPRQVIQLPRISPLYNVPTEIILCITDFLEPYEIACFALASKYMLVALGKRCFRLPQSDKQDLLEILQRDLPDKLLCRTCWRFPERHTHKSGERYCRDHICAQRRGRFDFGVNKYSLLLVDVQQILNRHQFGPEFGISVDDIEFQRKAAFERFPLPYMEKIRARIWANRLYLRVDTRTVFDRDNEDMKKAAIHWPRVLCADVSGKKLNYDTLTEMGKPFARCTSCKAEFRIEISVANQLQDTLKVTAWYKLGSVWDIYGIHWSKIVVRSGFEMKGISKKEAVLRKAFKRGLDKRRAQRTQVVA